MRTVLSTDKAIQVNDNELSKYGDANTDLWNLVMPSGGWRSSGRPERIIINDSIDLIHKDNIYEGSVSNSVSAYVSISNLYRDSKCGDDWFTFNYDFRLVPNGIQTAAGDYNIGFPANCFYQDQGIQLIVKYGTTSQPTKYSEVVDTFPAGSWSTGGRRLVSSFTTPSINDNLQRISWWVKTLNDNAPIRLTFNYSDKYGQGFSGSRQQDWYRWEDIYNGRKLCETTNFNYGSTSGSLASGNSVANLSYSKRIY